MPSTVLYYVHERGSMIKHDIVQQKPPHQSHEINGFSPTNPYGGSNLSIRDVTQCQYFPCGTRIQCNLQSLRPFCLSLFSSHPDAGEWDDYCMGSTPCYTCKDCTRYCQKVISDTKVLLHKLRTALCRLPEAARYNINHMRHLVYDVSYRAN